MTEQRSLLLPGDSLEASKSSLALVSASCPPRSIFVSASNVCASPQPSDRIRTARNGQSELDRARGQGLGEERLVTKRGCPQGGHRSMTHSSKCVLHLRTVGEESESGSPLFKFLKHSGATGDTGFLPPRPTHKPGALRCQPSKAVRLKGTPGQLPRRSLRHRPAR